MFHTSSIEISRGALKHNFEFIQKELRDGVKFSSVVKGNAYGHGIEKFVPLAEECGQDHFSVFSANEALRVNNVKDPDSGILIMGMLDKPELEWAIANEIDFYVFDMERLMHAIESAGKLGRKARIHIEVETGMNRTGFSTNVMSKVAKIIESNSDKLTFRGLCTHYAGAESIANYYRIKKQFQVFNRIAKKITRDVRHPLTLHTACSAAALRYPKSQMDMARIGILQYGFFPSREVMIDYLTKNKLNDYPLRRLITWKSVVMDIKKVKAGEFVGYGTSYLANRDMEVAIVPVGYSNGFTRSLSNQGRLLIRGQRVSVVGMVNMNMLSADITNLEGVGRGDEVIIIGNQGDLELSVASFSEFSEQINYELLTRLPADIPRRVID